MSIVFGVIVIFLRRYAIYLGKLVIKHSSTETTFFSVFFFVHPVTHARGHSMSCYFSGSQKPVSNHWAENLIKIWVNNYNEWNKTALSLPFYYTYFFFLHIYHKMTGTLELWHQSVTNKENIYFIILPINKNCYRFTHIRN